MTLSAVDRLALTDLVHRYAAGVDDCEFDLVAGLFTDSAQLAVPEPPVALEPVHWHHGPSAIAAAIASVTACLRTEHAIVGEVYSSGPRSDVARGCITCIAHHWNRRDEEVVDLVWHLRYADEYRLTTAGWLIDRRVLTINAIETRVMRRVRPTNSAG